MDYNSTTTNQNGNGYRRTSKHPSDETRQRISASLRGRTRPDLVKKRISDGMKQYWGTPENFPDDV